MEHRSLSRIIAILWLAGFASAPRAWAQAPEDFYRGREVTLLVGTSNGGMYDLLARFVAKHLPRFIPGSPRVVVKNMAGAGGVVAGNYLATNAPRDGTLVASLLNNVAFEPMFGTVEANYDPTRFQWIGSSNAETAFLTVWHATPIKTLADAQAHEVTVGASGASSAPTFFARLLNETLKTKLKIVIGYAGSNEAFLAMERGELDGYGSAFTTDLTAFKPNWIRDGMVRLLVQYGPAKEPEFANVPFAPDLVSDAQDKALMHAAFALLAMGRPYAMPPGTPPDRVAAMRGAFAALVHDPQVLQEAHSLGIAIDRAQSGARVQEVVQDTYRTPPSVIERLRKLKL